MLRAKSETKSARPLPLMAVALAVLLMFATPLPAFSQSCALCYTQAASAGARMIDALRSGILMLIVPPTLMSVCMVFIMRHKSTQFRLEKEVSDRDRNW
jgi:hypothetical protein